MTGSLEELLEAIGAQSPAPGAGSVSAWSGALAAALLQMVASYAGDPAVAARAVELRGELLSLAERELSSYQPVLAAQRAGSDVSAALSAASEAPLAIARACAEVAERAASVWASSRPAIRGDAVASVLLAEAAAVAAAELVAINLPSGDPRVGEAGALRAAAGEARGRVVGG